MDNKDRELQITLAKLQTDVQIELTKCFGLLAVFVAFFITFSEQFFSSGDFIFFAGMVGIMVLSFYSTHNFLQRMQKKRSEIEGLKKDYLQ